MITIFHSRDLDGYASGAIVRRRYPNTILIGYDYGQELVFPEEVRESLLEHDIIMIDVSMKMPEMFSLAQKCKSLKWIDHHISAMKDFEAVKDQAPANFTAVLENGISACEGAWNNLFPDTKMPKAIKLLGEYDTWRNKDKDNWDNAVMPFQYGMRIICNSPETFPNYLFGDNDEIIESIKEKGKVVIKYETILNESLCKKSFEIKFEGLRAICLNGAGFNSNVFKSVYDESKHDIMMPFQFDGKQWIVSLYTTKPEIDCSEIAKKYKGGGHRAASGFQILNLDGIFGFKKPAFPNDFITDQKF
jgi:uncharacterized protein